MFRNVKNIIKVASIYASTIIGAGFASGQEIQQFFSMYYKGGFYGIIMAGIIFSIVGYLVLNKVYKEKIRNFDELIIPIAGLPVSRVLEALIILFVFSLYCIMIAGIGNIVMQFTGMPYIICVSMTSFITMLVLSADIKGITSFSTFVTPLMIIAMICIGIYIVIFHDAAALNVLGVKIDFRRNWLFSSILYAGYNSIMAIIVMCSLLPYLKTRRTGLMGGTLGGMVLMLIALIINSAIALYYPDRIYGELPVVSILQKYNAVLSKAYMVILMLAMFISALTSGFCFADRVKARFKLPLKVILPVFCAISIPLSNIGFSNLISYLYPLFGYVGLFIILMVVFDSLRTYFCYKRKVIKIKNR